MPTLKKKGTPPPTRIRSKLILKVHGMALLHATFRKGLARGLADLGDAILAESQKRVPAGATVGLKDSGSREPTEPRDWVQVVYSAPYALFVHEGTKAHFPPPDALVRWCELVLGVRGREAKSAAFLVARAISVHGTKPNRFLADAAKEVWPKVEGILARAISGEIDRVAKSQAIHVLTAAALAEATRSEGTLEG